MKQLETENINNDLFKWFRQVISLTLQSKEQHWGKDLWNKINLGMYKI